MDRIKFRQNINGRFEYWGVNVGIADFAAPCSGNGANASNTSHDLWSGFTDSNGQEIYENDLVTWLEDGFGADAPEEVCGKVVYSDASFFFEYKDENGQTNGWPLYQEHGWYTVTGNAYGI